MSHHAELNGKTGTYHTVTDKGCKYIKAAMQKQPRLGMLNENAGTLQSESTWNSDACVWTLLIARECCAINFYQKWLIDNLPNV